MAKPKVVKSDGGVHEDSSGVRVGESLHFGDGGNAPTEPATHRWTSVPKQIAAVLLGDEPQDSDTES